MLFVPGRKILVQIEKEAPQTEGGILRPEVAIRELPSGIVKFVGEEIKGKEGFPKPGDKVFFPEAVAWKVEIEGETYAAIHFEEITAWIPGEKVQKKAP